MNKYISKDGLREYSNKYDCYLGDLLHESKRARESNEYAIARFYKDMYGITDMWEIVGNNKVLRIESISRKIRTLKAQDHSIPKVDKSEQEQKYKEQSKEPIYRPLQQASLF